MTSVRFHCKPFNITVIQLYAPTTNAEEAEAERSYEDLQDLLELTPKKTKTKTKKTQKTKNKKSRPFHHRSRTGMQK